MTRYFDIKYDTDGNYINFNCYLNPQEYLDIKNGAYIRIDSDTYQPIEVSGYDPSGRNKASIKAIQKIIANDAKDKQYNPSNPTPTASTPTMIKNYTFTSNAPSVINDVSGSFTIITYNIDSYFDWNKKSIKIFGGNYCYPLKENYLSSKEKTVFYR